ncbi:hypothetical protein F0562_010832 [Nyssa sinensis]|uniref:IST1-like protein n=1 Tax=Nyssa sinensis TaxID=561372 RepID=A0A5J5A2L3_9ASTE|nr:hypothetical protein F0562_010832 [Nyssa sinensis]
MFDILFGWRKASNCKKLIRRVQCRLKLLKNKRCSIVRQLREDVEQLFKDESIVAVYDLLDHFCEFIIIHLSYIRRHKDCPNDINEAVSSLIFASARCGDLPELQVIRKLFGERYGQRFAMAALELLPGNLVNHQIKENLSIKSVPHDVKCRLVDEIARSCLQPGPLALEYCSELQQQQANKITGDEIPISDIQTNCNRTEGSPMQDSKSTEREEYIVFVNFLSNGKTFLEKPFHSRQDSETTGTSICSSTVLHSSPTTVEASMDKKDGKVEKYTQLNSPYELTLEPKAGNIAAESSSESSTQLPEEMIYLDDIEEFQSPLSKDGNCQDQRLFMFKSSVLPHSKKSKGSYNEDYVEQYESWSEEAGSGSSKRSTKRLVSWDSSSVKDVESVICHGKACENSPSHKHKSHHHRKHQKKIPVDEIQDSYCVHERVEQPCRLQLENNSGSGKFRSFDRTKSCCSCSFNSEMVNDCSLEHPCHCSHNRELNIQGMRWAFLPQKTRENYQNNGTMDGNLTYPVHLPNKQSKKVGGQAEGSNYLGSGAASICSSSRVIRPWIRKEMEPSYLRAMTMPPERPKESCNDNILRFNSFPFRQPIHLNNGSSSQHVHPKLPDYDELAAKFKALKKANLQNKNH